MSVTAHLLVVTRTSHTSTPSASGGGEQSATVERDQDPAPDPGTGIGTGTGITGGEAPGAVPPLEFRGGTTMQLHGGRTIEPEEEAPAPGTGTGIATEGTSSGETSFPGGGTTTVTRAVDTEGESMAIVS